MIGWHLRRMTFGDTAAGHCAFFERVVGDGVLLTATVKSDGTRPFIESVTASFAGQARDFGRDLAWSDLERAINDSDLHRVETTNKGRMPVLALGEFLTGVPVRSSRGRPPQWTDARLAALVHDLEAAEVAAVARRWYLAATTIRQRANEAVRRGIAEPRPTNGGRKSWRLTVFGRSLLDATPGPSPPVAVNDRRR